MHSVLTAERKELLTARLGRDGRLVAKELARELGTSEDTIRRDLRDLAAEGRLQRVHGGALPASPATAAFAAREHIGVESKAAVARAAAALIRPGQTVAIDGGTTALQLVRSLDPGLEATVITHSPTIAVALADHPSVEVLLLGGRLFKHSIVTCGAITAEAVRSMHADAFFMGVTGVHPDAGLTTGDAEEAAIKRALVGPLRRHLRAGVGREDRRRVAARGDRPVRDHRRHHRAQCRRPHGAGAAPAAASTCGWHDDRASGPTTCPPARTRTCAT